MGYSPWGRKEPDMTELLRLNYKDRCPHVAAVMPNNTELPERVAPFVMHSPWPPVILPGGGWRFIY